MLGTGAAIGLGLMGGGSLLGGAGQIASAFGNQGGGMEQLSPEAQMYLAEKGLTNQEGQLDLNKAIAYFSQDMAQLGPEEKNARQKIINEMFGDKKDAEGNVISKGIQSQAFDQLRSALAGESTAADRNVLAEQGVQMGRGMQSARDRASAMMARSNLDPRSPAYAEQMNRLETQLQSQFSGQQSSLRSQQQQQNMANAGNLYSSLLSGPLAGQEPLNVPKSTEEQREFDRAEAVKGGAESFQSDIAAGGDMKSAFGNIVGSFIPTLGPGQPQKNPLESLGKWLNQPNKRPNVRPQGTQEDYTERAEGE